MISASPEECPRIVEWALSASRSKSWDGSKSDYAPQLPPKGTLHQLCVMNVKDKLAHLRQECKCPSPASESYANSLPAWIVSALLKGPFAACHDRPLMTYSVTLGQKRHTRSWRLGWGYKMPIKFANCEKKKKEKSSVYYFCSLFLSTSLSPAFFSSTCVLCVVWGSLSLFSFSFILLLWMG